MSYQVKGPSSRPVLSGAMEQVRAEAPEPLEAGHHRVTGSSSGTESPSTSLSNTKAPTRRGELRWRSSGTTRFRASWSASAGPSPSRCRPITRTMSSPASRWASTASVKVTTRSSTNCSEFQSSMQIGARSPTSSLCRCISSWSSEIVLSQGARKNSKGTASRIGLLSTGKAARTSGFFWPKASVEKVPRASVTVPVPQTMDSDEASRGRSSVLKTARSSVETTGRSAATKDSGHVSP